MIFIGYFVDGPLHGSHLEMTEVPTLWHVARGATRNTRHQMFSEGDPQAYLHMTIEAGKYARDVQPVITSPRAAVFTYRWKGWQ